jgi:anti-sigma B factor antagonist
MDNSTSSPAAGLSISGEFTVFTAREIKQRLLDAIRQSETSEIEIDLSSVTEIDSAGLQLMVMAKIEGLCRDKTVRFCRHSDPVLDLIDTCGLSRFFGDPLLLTPRE